LFEEGAGRSGDASSVGAMADGKGQAVRVDQLPRRRFVVDPLFRLEGLLRERSRLVASVWRSARGPVAWRTARVCQ
jgi:hypothetical protein